MAKSRIVVADALRAFALLGIAVAHASNEYLGIPPFDYTNRFTEWEKILGPWIDLLVIGKFFTIFSFLFGLSFSFQLASAEREGQAWAGRFLWRLGILFGMGVVHTLFFAGDILIVYAVAGVALLATPRLSSRALVVVGMLLALNLPMQLNRLRMQVLGVTAAEKADEKQLMAEVERLTREDLRIKQTGSVADLVGWNLRTAFWWKALFQLFSGRIFVTIGLFFLGVAAGRSRWYEDTAEHRRWLGRALGVTLPVGAITTVLTHRWNPTLLASPHELYPCLGLVSFDLQQMTLSIAYAAAFVLGCWRWEAHPLFGWLQRVGRMGLTIYLLMSVAGMLLFFGFGLGWLGRGGMFVAIAVGVGSTLVLFGLADFWMKRFRFGPVEWLWRCATNLRWEPMRGVL